MLAEVQNLQTHIHLQTDNIFHQHIRLSLQRATISLIQIQIYCEGKDGSMYDGSTGI